MKLLTQLTGTTNLFINLLVVSAILIIVIPLIALIIGCALNPNLLVNASFGL